MSDFSGETVIVTGGTRGIGRAISEAFIAAGARVVAIYSGNEEAARKLAKAHPDRVDVVRLDVSDYNAVEKFYREFEEKYESLEILVNNAGIRRDGVVGMLKQDDWQSVMDINLSGTFYMSKFALQLMMRKKYGRIINITSPAGYYGLHGQSNYSASKAGQVAFTRSMAKEVGSRNITVNCVSPGFIDTDFIADLPDDLKKSYKSQVPVRRFGTPAEVARCVLFIADRDSGFITGSVLEVAGGF